MGLYNFRIEIVAGVFIGMVLSICALILHRLHHELAYKVLNNEHTTKQWKAARGASCETADKARSTEMVPIRKTLDAPPGLDGDPLEQKEAVG